MIKRLSKISPSLKNYGLALLFIGASCVLTAFFQKTLNFNTGLFFFSAVLLSTWFGNRTSGLLATILVSLALNAFLKFPAISFDLSPSGVFRTLFFAVIAFSMSWIMSERKQSATLNTNLLNQIETDRKRLADLLASVPGVVWEAWGKPDASSQRINFVSDYVEKMLGYTVNEWLAKPNFWLSIVHPEDKERAAAHAAEHFRKGYADINSFRWVAKDGREIWVDSHSSVIFDQNNNPVGMRGVTLNVSERKLTEEALRISENRFRTLIEQSPFSIQIFSTDGTTILTNKAWEKLWGISSEENSRYNILKDRQLVEKGLMPFIERAFAGEAVAVPPNSYVPTKGEFAGKPLWVSAYIYPVKDLSGKTREIVLVHEDISERVKFEQEREQLLFSEQSARIKAEEANQIKDEFLATLSHELRTPLSAILGWTQMLKSGSLDAATGAYALTVIERNARNQNQLIDDILDVSRIITGKFRLNIAPMKIDSAVESAIDSVRFAAQAKNIGLEYQKEETNEIIYGDSNRLQQVFWNLLLNAVKFTPEGGEIRTEIKDFGNFIRITISDNGIGIAPDFLPYVFDRFRQADGSTTRKHGGLGLGLSIVRHIVEIHGGSVSVASEGEGKGAIFTVELPVRDNVFSFSNPNFSFSSPIKSSAKNDSQIPVLNNNLEGYRILLVEDEIDSLEILTFLLKKCGADVLPAKSAAEAIAILKKTKPDVIISDIGMPEESGYDFIKKVRKLQSSEGGSIPAIALTAYVTEQDTALAKNAGFQIHLAKPVDENTLLEAVLNLIHQQKNLVYK